jgi:muramoyltetrapeptide carboxypeptidase
VWAARGGYGISRILGDVRFPTRARPPLLVGFSDVSLLLARAWAAGLPCVHGPNVTTLGLEDRLAVGGEPTGDHPFDCAQGRRPSTFPPGGRPLRSCLDEASRDALFAFLLGGQVPDYGKLECLHGGCATGPVLPMNLSLLASVSGTPLCPSLDGVILLLEDVSEPAYRVDRLLLQVVLSGGFDRIAGLVLGDFEDALEHRTLLCSIRQWTSARRLPCVMGFPMGHGARNFPVPVGWTGDLDAAAGRLALRVPAPGSA